MFVILSRKEANSIDELPQTSYAHYCKHPILYEHPVPFLSQPRIFVFLITSFVCSTEFRQWRTHTQETIGTQSLYEGHRPMFIRAMLQGRS
jgi:hypothetical protein